MTKRKLSGACGSSMEQPSEVPYLTAAHCHKQKALNDGPQQDTEVRVLPRVAVNPFSGPHVGLVVFDLLHDGLETG